MRKRIEQSKKKKKSLNAALNLCFRLPRTSPNPEDLPCELVAGEGSIHEELLGLKFRISPHSFFQVRKIYLQDFQQPCATNSDYFIESHIYTISASVWLYLLPGRWIQELRRCCTLLWGNGPSWMRTALCWMCAVGQGPSVSLWLR